MEDYEFIDQVIGNVKSTWTIDAALIGTDPPLFDGKVG